MARAMIPDDEATIARRYSAGEGIVKLAREYRVRTSVINDVLARHEARRAAQTCSIGGCGASPVVGRGWCRKHYNLWHKHGDPLHVPPPKEPRSRFTAEEQQAITEAYRSGGDDPSRIIAILTEQYACSKPTIYRIVRQNGGETRSKRRPREEPPPPRPTVCTASGCDRILRTNAVVNGLCREHQREALKAAAPACSVEGCGKSAQVGRSHGLCVMHFHRLRHRGELGGVEAERVHSYNGALCQHPDGCAEPAAVRGWCMRHWDRIDRTGDPGPVGLIPRLRVVSIDGIDHRPCSTCGDVKPVTDFYFYKSTGYYDADCKPCARKLAVVARHANLERARENSRRYYRENPDKVKAHTIMRRDIARSGQPGEEINVREVADAFGWICQLCGEPIDPEIKHRQWDAEPMGLSLDHIVPLSRGGLHVRTNVQPAHHLCNVRKQNRLEEDAAG